MRDYVKLDNNTRQTLINLILDKGLTIRAASQKLQINYENAKAIYRAFRLQKRVKKIDRRNVPNWRKR